MWQDVENIHDILAQHFRFALRTSQLYSFLRYWNQVFLLIISTTCKVFLLQTRLFTGCCQTAGILLSANKQTCDQWILT